MHFPETFLPGQEPATEPMNICHDPSELVPAWRLIGALAGQEQAVLSNAERLDRAMHNAHTTVLDLIDGERRLEGERRNGILRPLGRSLLDKLESIHCLTVSIHDASGVLSYGAYGEYDEWPEPLQNDLARIYGADEVAPVPLSDSGEFAELLEACGGRDVVFSAAQKLSLEFLARGDVNLLMEAALAVSRLAGCENEPIKRWRDRACALGQRVLTSGALLPDERPAAGLLTAFAQEVDLMNRPERFAVHQERTRGWLDKGTINALYMKATRIEFDTERQEEDMIQGRKVCNSILSARAKDTALAAYQPPTNKVLRKEGLQPLLGVIGGHIPVSLEVVVGPDFQGLENERARGVVGCLRQLASVCERLGDEGPRAFRQVIADDKTRQILFEAAAQQLQAEGVAAPTFGGRFLQDVAWIEANWPTLGRVLPQVMPNFSKELGDRMAQAVLQQEAAGFSE